MTSGKILQQIWAVTLSATCADLRELVLYSVTTDDSAAFWVTRAMCFLQQINTYPDGQAFFKVRRRSFLFSCHDMSWLEAQQIPNWIRRRAKPKPGSHRLVSGACSAASKCYNCRFLGWVPKVWGPPRFSAGSKVQVSWRPRKFAHGLAIPCSTQSVQEAFKKTLKTKFQNL